MPSNANLLPYRSNIEYLSDYCLRPADPEFAANAKANGGGFIVGGSNYGQGSSREHAALVPLYLGVKAVIAKSFARIHKANLINNGILPLELANESDYEKFDKNDVLQLNSIREEIGKGITVTVTNQTKQCNIITHLELSSRLKEVILAGGVLAHIASKNT